MCLYCVTKRNLVFFWLENTSQGTKQKEKNDGHFIFPDFFLFYVCYFFVCVSHRYLNSLWEYEFTEPVEKEVKGKKK